MSIIQDSVNKIIEEKEQQDFANSIVDQRRQDFEEFLENQKNNVVNYAAEEIAYMNSNYYPKYLAYLKDLGTYIASLKNEMIYTYESNRINFNDAFFRGIKRTLDIVGIGFPIPERFLEQIKNTVEDKLCEGQMVGDGLFEVNVIPSQYTITGSRKNIGKPLFIYKLCVELKRKNINEKQKQKNIYK